MKNIVRAFVAALVLTGTVAAAHSATKVVPNTVAHSTPSPNCEPGVPDGCGI